MKDIDTIKYVSNLPARDPIDYSKIPYNHNLQICADCGYHWVIGFVNPSSSLVPLEDFYRLAIELGYLTPEGDLLNPDMALPVRKYSNHYLLSGIWYAWSPQAIEEIKSSYEETLTEVSLEEDDNPYPPGAGDLM